VLTYFKKNIANQPSPTTPKPPITGMVRAQPGFTAPESDPARGLVVPPPTCGALGATVYAAVEGHGPVSSSAAGDHHHSAIKHEDAPETDGGALGPVLAGAAPP